MATRLEWDENKNHANRRKHGIDFTTAARVFADPNAIMRHDRTVDSEQRWHTIAALDGGLVILLVVHTINERIGEPVIRIISARKATRQERKLYEEGDYPN